MSAPLAVLVISSGAVSGGGSAGVGGGGWAAVRAQTTADTIRSAKPLRPSSSTGLAGQLRR